MRKEQKEYNATEPIGTSGTHHKNKDRKQKIESKTGKSNEKKKLVNNREKKRERERERERQKGGKRKVSARKNARKNKTDRKKNGTSKKMLKP